MALSNDEQLLLRDSLQRFIADNYGDSRRRAFGSGTFGFSSDNWRQFSDFGWLGIGIDAAFGGSGGSLRDVCIVMNYAGRALMVEPFLESAVLGAWLIEHGVTSPQKTLWLPAIAEGRLLVTLAHTEPESGFDRSWVTTKATETDNGYLLNGVKSPVYHGPSADLYIVSAVSRAQPGVSLFAVDRHSPGLKQQSVRGVDGTPQSRIVLRDVHVSTERRFSAADARVLLEAAMNRAVLAVSSKSLGSMQAALAATVDYVKSRIQFGRPLAAMQTVRHRLVDMHIAYTKASALTAAAIDLHDRGSTELDRAVSAARLATIRAGREIGEQSIQLHGGMGMTDALMIGHFYKSLLAAAPLFGDAEWHLNRLAGLP